MKSKVFLWLPLVLGLWACDGATVRDTPPLFEFETESGADEDRPDHALDAESETESETRIEGETKEDPPSDGDGSERDAGREEVVEETAEAEEERPITDGDDWPLGEEEDDPSETEAETPVYETCRAFDDCPDEWVCNYALGRCEFRRTDRNTADLRFYAFTPPSGANGDMLIVDGNGFTAFTTLMIGSRSLGFNQFEVSENRLIARLQSGDEGTLSATVQILTVASALPLRASSDGILPCDGATPDASGIPGDTLGEMGPFAAGYLDLPLESARLYYPAQCGSNRRPPVPGTYPFVAILHGNGSPHLSYDYLGQWLASWGMISVTPDSVEYQEYNEEVTDALYSILSAVRGRELGTLSPVLAGLSATEEMLFIGHSRGCMRTQNVIQDYDDIRTHTLGAVFLGPADLDYVVPGAFLAIGATMDMDSWPYATTVSYNRQPAPKWKVMVQGGNHGLFTDHKIYPFGYNSTITRKQQLDVIQDFTLPFIQRAFGMEEPFAAQLDAPPASPLYTEESLP